MCMYTCTCMSCIYSMSWIHRYMYKYIPSRRSYLIFYLDSNKQHFFSFSMSWIHRYMYISIPSPSRNSSHAVMVSCLTWFPWTPPPRPQCSHVRHPRVPPRNVRHFSDPWEKNRVCCFGGKKIVTSKRRELTSPPQGDHYQNGKGTGIKGTRQFPKAFPELFPKTKGTHTSAKTGSKFAFIPEDFWNDACLYHPLKNSTL